MKHGHSPGDNGKNWGSTTSHSAAVTGRDLVPVTFVRGLGSMARSSRVGEATGEP